MAKKMANGMGSIRQRNDGKYEGRITLGKTKDGSVITLKGVLGHSKASFTVDTYSHATDEMIRKDAEKMNQRFYNSPKSDESIDHFPMPF